MGLVDSQYKDNVLKRCIEERKELFYRVQMLEKLLELNMKDFWDVVDQRDWYYESYCRLKKQNENN